MYILAGIKRDGERDIERAEGGQRKGGRAGVKKREPKKKR